MTYKRYNFSRRVERPTFAYADLGGSIGSSYVGGEKTVDPDRSQVKEKVILECKKRFPDADWVSVDPPITPTLSQREDVDDFEEIGKFFHRLVSGKHKDIKGPVHGIVYSHGTDVWEQLVADLCNYLKDLEIPIAGAGGRHSINGGNGGDGWINLIAAAAAIYKMPFGGLIQSVNYGELRLPFNFRKIEPGAARRLFDNRNFLPRLGKVEFDGRRPEGQFSINDLYVDILQIKDSGKEKGVKIPVPKHLSKLILKYPYLWSLVHERATDTPRPTFLENWKARLPDSDDGIFVRPLKAEADTNYGEVRELLRRRDGVILFSYGSGTTNAEIAKALRHHASEKGALQNSRGINGVVAILDTPSGALNLAEETDGVALIEEGVIPGGDRTYFQAKYELIAALYAARKHLSNGEARRFVAHTIVANSAFPNKAALDKYEGLSGIIQNLNYGILTKPVEVVLKEWQQDSYKDAKSKA